MSTFFAAIEKIRPLSWDKNLIFWAFIIMPGLLALFVNTRVESFVNLCFALSAYLLLGKSEKKQKNHGTINLEVIVN